MTRIWGIRSWRTKFAIALTIQITDQLPVAVGWVVRDFNAGAAGALIANPNDKSFPGGQPAFADYREETTPGRQFD